MSQETFMLTTILIETRDLLESGEKSYICHALDEAVEALSKRTHIDSHFELYRAYAKLRDCIVNGLDGEFTFEGWFLLSSDIEYKDYQMRFARIAWIDRLLANLYEKGAL